MSRLTYPGPEPVSIQPSTPLGYSSSISSFGQGAQDRMTDLGFSSSGFQTRPQSRPSGLTPVTSTMSSTAGAAADVAGGADTGGWMNSKFWGEDGFNLGSIGTIAQSIGAFGNIWNGFQQNKLAKDALSFQKDAYKTNLANQISSFNMALEDRTNARFAQEGRSSAAAADYINKYKLEK